ncbi:unnamed protein product [marine sediment metagenome]|uniref:YbbR-like domain-containing protein n=1 Tax=marine sediment metagenome TaxID=412755 RepID=X1J033_9ZZZZ
MKELRNWLLKNIDIKLLSLFLAIILWLYIASGENPIIENFFDVSLATNNLREDLVVKEFPLNISVGIKGPKNVINSISPHQIIGVVDFSDINEAGIYKLKVEVIAPKRTEITRIIPSDVKVDLERVLTQIVEEVTIQVKESIIQKILKNIPVIPQDLSPFVSCEIEPKVVDVIVEGQNILIESIKEEDIKAFVGLTDSFQVEQKVKVQIVLPEGISLIKIEPEEVMVIINK